MAIIIADYLTKEWALRALSPDPFGRAPRIPVVPGFLDFLLAFNTGGAFSIFNEQPWLITLGSTLITIGLFVWLVYFCLKADPDVPLARLSFGLILGGAIGNLIDRYRFQYVVDFIHAYIQTGDKEYAWPTFNIADMGIVVGIGLMLYLSLLTNKLDPAPPPEETAAAADEESPGPPGNADAPPPKREALLPR